MSDLEAGARLGPYDVLDVVGRGGMGTVYKGYDRTLDRHVALKVFHAHFLAEPGFADRFRREARIWGRLDHPAIVPVYFADIVQERPFLAMKFVEGGSLLDRLKGAALDLPRAVAILVDVGGALGHAHAHGIVHRDVKPANVLLGEGDRAYLSDFGIARVIASASVARTTGVFGTPGYMAPEQARGQEPDPRSDIYSLGCMAYEMLTGAPPFRGATPVEVMMRHIHDVPTPPRILSPALPAEAERAILTAIAKDPEARWQTAADFVRAVLNEVDLESLRTISLHRHPALPTPSPTDTRPAASRRPRSRVRWPFVAALGVTLAGAALFSLQATPPAGDEDHGSDDGATTRALQGATRRAMDQGAYPEALRMAEIASRLTPTDPGGRNLVEQVRRAWEAERRLGLWSTAAAEAEPAGPAVAPVDEGGARR